MDLLAIYGSFLSTALLGWEIYKWRRDQPNVSVKCFLAVQTITPLPPDIPWHVQYDDETPTVGGDPFLVFRVTNIGTRDVLIEKVGGSYNDGQSFSASWDPVPLPRRLNPADSFQFAVARNVVRDDLDFLAVWDSSGKIWKAPHDQTEQIKSNA